MSNEPRAGDRYINKSGLKGQIVAVNQILRLQVVNAFGRITQTIKLKDIDLNKFEKVIEDKDNAKKEA